ncbi:hypothetical protein J6590_096628 [Homalodisca vitripennis]|nr:hypothetical protein J6590_096628 [Homalodisca vitripennis]
MIFECGLNVIVNAKYIVNYYCSPRRKEEFTDWFYCNVVTLPDCPSPALNSVIPSSTPSHNQSQSSPPQLDNNTHTTSCKVDTVKLVRCKGDKWKLVKSNSKRKRSKQTKLPRQEVSIECGNKYVVLSDIDVDDCTELNTTPGVCGTSKLAKELSVSAYKDETQSFEPGTPEPHTPTAPEIKPYTPEPERDTPAITSGNDSKPHPNPPS